MACVPLTSNKRRLQFDAAVNIDSLMAVPYVNGVFFTKLRLLSRRNSRQYTQRVSVVDNSVHFNSSHTFQCKVHVNPETNVLESCRLKISVRMESDGGKSFHKIGYVIVDLACFVLTGFVRCRRRYLLKGYDGDKRRAGKRQDNSLLVVSFICQQHFGDACFRPPVEDLSNCVSTSHSLEALDPASARGGNIDVLQTSTAATTAPSTVLPSLLTMGWTEERIKMRSRRWLKEPEEGGKGVRVEGSQLLASRSEVDMGKFGEGNVLINDSDALSTNFPASTSPTDEQMSSGGEYISPTSVSIDQEEVDETESFSSPLPHQPSSLFLFVTNPFELIQRIKEEGEGEGNQSLRGNGYLKPQPVKKPHNSASIPSIHSLANLQPSGRRLSGLFSVSCND